MSDGRLPLPPFYDPAHAADAAYVPDQQRLFEEAAAWRRAHRLGIAADDRRRVHLLLIDLQKDFCFPGGTLYVGGRSGRGALEDNDRTARFLYANLGRVTDVTCTMDTHHPYQIFFPSFWVDAAGEPLAPHREITVAEVRSGAVGPNPVVAAWTAGGDQAWLRAQAEFYCAELERAGRYKLYLWPPHCILGSDGHALAGVVHEARLFHAFVRGSRAAVAVKGEHPLTENYSVFSPEVTARHDGGVLAPRNDALVHALLESDALVVAGQAASHCVRSSLDDLLAVIQARDPGLARKVWVLRDCMSSVAVPDPGAPGRFAFDFTPDAERALERWAAAGMHVVDSTDPMDAW